jgi:orotidine-5'-phosphate decarboxylase
VILLALTSNAGAFDFQTLETQGGAVYKEVLRKAGEWGNASSMMFVVGATKADMLSEIRKIVPDHFLLVPGVGAQGGSLSEVFKYGSNKDCGLLVNASRSIIYAGSGSDFAEKAIQEARKMQDEMSALLRSA